MIRLLVLGLIHLFLFNPAYGTLLIPDQEIVAVLDATAQRPGYQKPMPNWVAKEFKEVVSQSVAPGKGAGLIDDTLKTAFKSRLSGLDDEAVEQFAKVLNAKFPNSASNIFNGLMKQLDEGTNLGNLSRTISDLKNNWGKLAEGAEWVLSYVTSPNGIKTLKGKKLHFELITESVTSTVRRIDLADITDDLNHIYYEFKSVSTFFNSTYAGQILSDFENVKSLQNLKWIYNGAKDPTVSKQTVVNLLQSNSNFGSAKMIDLFKRYSGESIRDVAELKTYLINSNDWFEEIFKVVY